MEMRMYCPVSLANSVVGPTTPGSHTNGTLREMQLADPSVRALLQAKEQNRKPHNLGTDKSACRFLQIWDQLMMKDGLLCRYLQPGGTSRGVLQIVIPEALRTEILADLHEGVAGEAEKTLARLRERFYWPGHYNDVKEWCPKCAVCASRKSPAPKARAPLQSIVTSRPLELVASDIVGPLPESPAGNIYILVVADYFTRYVKAYPIPNQEATTVAHQLVDQFFMRFSPPERLHSDQGRNFESSLIAKTCKLLGVEKSRTTPYHPQSDGLVERFNRTLLDMLATAVIDKPFNWEEHLPCLCSAYNTSVHPTTGYSPFTLMFGRQARLPTEIALGTPNPPPTMVTQYADNLCKSLDFAYECVRKRMGHQLGKQKTQYDTRVHGQPFQVGDLVWLHNPAVPQERSKKLHWPWNGPYKVMAHLSKSVYRLKHLRRTRCCPVVHFDRLKLCHKDIRLEPGCSQSTRGTAGARAPRDPPTPPVGSRVEVLDDDVSTDSPRPHPGPPPDNAPPPPPSSAMVGESPGISEHSEQCAPQARLSPPSVTDPSPQRRRYPQRNRSAPVRLHAMMGT